MRHRIARGVLILGVVALLLYLGPRWPREQTLLFRLGPSGAAVTRLEASWVKEGNAELAGGMTLDFPDAAPDTVRHTVSLPNGEYTVTVELTRQASPDGSNVGSDDRRTKTKWTRRVILGGKETSLPLGDPP